MTVTVIDPNSEVQKERNRIAREFRLGVKPTVIEPESKWYCRDHMDNAVDRRGKGCEECAREAKSKQYQARQMETDNESQERESY